MSMPVANGYKEEMSIYWQGETNHGNGQTPKDDEMIRIGEGFETHEEAIHLG